ncbi:MAG: ABC transporter permease [Planctomycetes bacterium]|nr:ABC transporter permease [Planctomycetota bacterium]
MALKYIRSHKIIYFSIAGISIGIMVLIIVISVMNGFSRDIRHRIKGLNSSFQIHGNGIYIKDYDSLVKEIKTLPNVLGAAPRVENVAWLGRPGYKRRNVVVLGIEPEFEKTTSLIETYFKAGSKKIFDFDWKYSKDDPPVVVGNEVMVVGSEVPVFDGQRVGLTTVREDVVPRIFNGDFTVIGTFMSGMYEYDSSYILMPLKSAQKFLNLACSCSKESNCTVDKSVCTCPECNCQIPVVNYIAIEISDYADNREKARQDILNILHKRSKTCSSERHAYGRCGYYSVSSWEELKSNLLQAVSMERNIQSVIIFFIIIVAGFNIVAIFTLLVKSKVRDIGILRSFGVTKKQIAKIFLYCGIFAGLIGALSGVIFGLRVSYSLNEIADLMETGSKSFVEFLRAQKDQSFIFSNYLLNFLPAIAVLFAVLKFTSNRIGWIFQVIFGAAFLSLTLICFGLKLNQTLLEICVTAGFLLFLLLKYTDLGNSVFRILYIVGIAGLCLNMLEPNDNFAEYLLKDFMFRFIVFSGLIYFSFKVLTQQQIAKTSLWITYFMFVVAGTITYFVLNNLPSLSWPGLNIFPRDVYYLDRIPAMVDYNSILITVTSALIVSLISCIYPALLAASMEPVEAIRKE